MAYSVKEIFYTLQGEGAQVGRPAVFCRFAGCNLWNGREADRSAAICRFCDTDFVGTGGDGGGRFRTPSALADAVSAHWTPSASGRAKPLVVCTGGEPLLQLDGEAVEAFHERDFDLAVETNGTVPAPAGIDWICVSPKAGAQLKVRRGQELKLIFPQLGAEPELFENLDFDHFFLQPLDLGATGRNTRLALDYCRKHPQWRLSLQVHKLLGIR